MSNNTYNKSKTFPFTYLIGWSQLDTLYYGVRYKDKCNPKDLWSNYFTSSKTVEEFRKINGEPDIIQIRKTFGEFDKLNKEEKNFILGYEHTVLRRLCADKNPKFLNKSNGGKNFYILGHSVETRNQMSLNRTGKPKSEQHKLNMKNPKSEKHKNNIRISVGTGINHHSYGKPLSDEHKRKMSETTTGIPKTEEHKKKIGLSQIGKIINESTKKLLSDINKDKLAVFDSINFELIFVTKEEYANGKLTNRYFISRSTPYKLFKSIKDKAVDSIEYKNGIEEINNKKLEIHEYTYCVLDLNTFKTSTVNKEEFETNKFIKYISTNSKEYSFYKTFKLLHVESEEYKTNLLKFNNMIEIKRGNLKK